LNQFSDFALGESLLRAIVSGPDETARHLNVVVPANWPEFPEAFPYALEMEYMPLSHRILPALLDVARA